MVQYSDTLTESLRFSRTLVFGWGLSRTEGLALASVETPGIRYSLTETFGLGYEHTQAETVYKVSTASDLCSFQETHLVKMTYTPTETQGLGFQPLTASGWPRTLTEGLGLDPDLTVAVVWRVIEGLDLASVLDPKAKYTHTLTEGLGLTYSLANFFAGAIVEGLAFSPAVTPVMNFPLTLTEGLGASATVTPTLVFRITATEGLNLDDVDAIKMVFKPSLTEGLELSALYVAPDGSMTTWAINTRTGAVTEYTNYEFNSFAKFGNKYLAASSDGLYELLGNNDDGTNIIAKMKTGFAQFAGSHLCHFKAIYLGVRNGGTYYLRIETAEGTTTTYQLEAEDMKTTRIQVGKGLRARYFAFELETVDGQDFDLESIEFVPLVVQRRR